jgi:hypothetical protein
VLRRMQATLFVTVGPFTQKGRAGYVSIGFVKSGPTLVAKEPAFGQRGYPPLLLFLRSRKKAHDRRGHLESRLPDPGDGAGQANQKRRKELATEVSFLRKQD